MKQSVRISLQTRERLKQLKIHNNDSYDNVLNRVLDAKLGTMKIKYKLVDEFSTIFAYIDYNQLEPNIIFEYKGELYTCVDDLPISLNFKKKLKGFDFFVVLPLLNVGEVRSVENILLSVDCEGVR